MSKVIVQNITKKTRLDQYLASILNISRNKIVKMINEKKVTVNEKHEKPSFILSNDDIVLYQLLEETKTQIQPIMQNLEIIYEDDYLLVVNKPQGLVVHPAPTYQKETLVHGLIFHINGLSSLDNLRPGIVHRLDKDTSGLLIVAKNDFVLNKLQTMLKNREIKRTYIAITSNVVDVDAGKIIAKIGRDPRFRQRMAVTEQGKDAITHFKVITRFKENTLLELELETGRTHQIRVHLNYIGFPVWGDVVYGDKKNTDGQYLHAQKLKFKHPITSELLELSTTIPQRFYELMEKF